LISETFYDRFSPLAKRFDERYLTNVQSELVKARMNSSAIEYVSLCLGVSLCAGVVSLLSFASIPSMTIPLFLIVTALAFLVSSRYPTLRKIKFAKSVEKEMRFALRYFAVQLRVGVSFERAMKKITESNYRVLSKEFAAIVSDVNNGKSVPAALNAFADRTHSKDVRKMTNALALTYAKGGDGTFLKKMMDEQNAAYRIRLKEYNAKLMMYSLLFIGVGAIAPALFQATFTLGSVFMDFGVSPVTAFVIIVVVFPSINAVLLWWLNWKKP
jgi:tight adherence protein C